MESLNAGQVAALPSACEWEFARLGFARPESPPPDPLQKDQSPPAVGGGMEHDEQKDTAASSTSTLPITSPVELSERDNKETLVVLFFGGS